MDKKTQKERQMSFESLPPAIKETLTDEEIHAFLNEEQWPESLFEKLEAFIVKE
jgi:hypothetical protein